VLNYMINGLEQSMGDGHDGFFRSQSCPEAEILGSEIAAFDPDRRPSSFHKGRPEAAGTDRTARSESLARTLVISWADTAPGAESRRSAKGFKRGTDFGQNGIRSHEVDAWYGSNKSFN
jgi:hypothetical protein